MKRIIILGATAAALLALGAYGVTKFTTDQALVTAAPVAVNLGGVTAANGTNRSFATADHTHSITGTTKIANGGTNSATALSGSSIMVSNGTAIIQGAAGTTTTVLHGNAASTPAYSAVSLTADVTGTLAGTNGGTGVSGSPLLTASSTAGQSINSGAYTVIVFGTVETDSDSAYNSGTGVFTVPTLKGGHYAVTCSANYALALTATDVEIAIRVAGAIKRDVQAVNPPAAASLLVTGVVSASAVQTIDCVTFQNTGGAKSLTTIAGQTYINIKRLPD